MIRETCCGDFPERVCGNCPYANAAQRTPVFYRADGAKAGRCEDCFLPYDNHLVGEKCPPARQEVTPPAPKAEPAPVAATAPRPRPKVCPSCANPWNGVRGIRPVEGLVCGTCWQQQSYQ